MMRMKELVRSALRSAGYEVTRLRPPNRFQGMRETLSLLRALRYSPKIVIDAGANYGLWTNLVRPIFPGASFHLIEPQPICAALLRREHEEKPRIVVHAVAVTEPGVTRVRLVGGGVIGGGTGARVATEAEAGPDEIECPATTLDELLADQVGRGARCLCKLDLERHELSALRGATRLLRAVEVIVSEVVFYDINGRGDGTFADMVDFLRQHNFELYDFACLGSRPRDMRLQMGDVVFVRRDSSLMADNSWQ
jgi:FkbM family methyltransferase